MNIIVWNEYRHEKENPAVAKIYPDGIHATLQSALQDAGHEHVGTATLDEPEHGLSEARLAETDVLLWWGHKAHDDVDDAIAKRVCQRVLDGMGLVVLHSGHLSKPFMGLMGTGCMLKWRDDGERERIWVVDPSHPIAANIPERIEIEQEEMYGEHFDIPAPDHLVMVSWFQGGEVFRSGCCFHRGRGRIFYFRPGHETFPTYYHPDVRKVIDNAVRWVAPVNTAAPLRDHQQPLEPIGG